MGMAIAEALEELLFGIQFKNKIIMAHFAEIDSNNVVIRVLVVPEEQVHRGNDYLSVDLALGGNWIQTSYNTRCGVHLSGGVPFRKNYAAKGYTYDPQKDAFIPPKPYNSWVLNESSCCWFPPVPYPKDGNQYWWDDATNNWVINIPLLNSAGADR